MYGYALRAVRQRGSTPHTCLGDCLVALGLFTRTTCDGSIDLPSRKLFGTSVLRRTYASSVDTEAPSVNRSEAAKFAKLSGLWWDPNGPFKPLHAMNRARCEFIKGVVEEYADHRQDHGTSSANDRYDAIHTVDRRTDEKRIIRILDVGCGGGILSESLVSLPLKDPSVEIHVLGIDVNQEGIDTAMEHRRTAHPNISSSRLAYRAITIEDLLAEKASSSHVDGRNEILGPDTVDDLPDSADQAASSQASGSLGAFDITIASEVIEHVDHPEVFCRNLIRATAPGGRVIVSTLNRTVKSYGLAILGAETLLRIVPEGTHDWSKFLTPEELVLMMKERERSSSLDAIAGMVFNPLSGLWRCADDVDVNYIASFSV